MSKQDRNQAIDFEEKIIRSSSNAASEVRFIQDRKQLALSKLKDLNFPNSKHEDWKYFDFSDILAADFPIEKKSKLKQTDLAKLIDQYVFRESVDNLLVTVNGAYSEELSSFDFNNENLKILNFNNPKEIQADPEIKSIVEKLFAKNIENEERYFKAINTVLMENGFLLYAKDNYVSKTPLQILHISNSESFNQIRSLIYAGKNSELDILVTYIGLEDSKYFTNAVIECFLEDNAKVKLEKIQNESQESTRLYNFSASLEKDANFEYNSYCFGAKSNREDIDVDILGEGAHADINSLYVLSDARKSHHKVTVKHKAENTTSNQLFKGILHDQARAEFNGLIEVARDAQKTDAKQLNNNLLLSKDAHVDSRPQLDILADDVKCAHGSTVGKLNEDELFYLQSRGLSENDAKTVLTYSFCQELIEKISLESARNYASNLAFTTLSNTSETLATLAENSKFKKARYESSKH